MALRNPASDLVAVITGQTLGGSALVSGTNLFVGQSRPDDTALSTPAVFVLNTGGKAPDIYLNSQGSLFAATVQILVRSAPDDFQTGESVARAVFSAVHLASVTGYLAVYVRESQPTYLGMDESNRAQWSINIELQYSGDEDIMAALVYYKEAVRAASTVNVTRSGTQTIDGIALVVGDRVLLKNQTAGAENGIYVVAAAAWSRSTDADANAEMVAGVLTYVTLGTVGGGTFWVLSTAGAITLGTTSIAFSQVDPPVDLSSVNTRLTTLEASSHAAVIIGTANGLSLVGQALSLAEAGAAQAGAVTTGAQSFAGVKTFSSAITSSVASGADAITLNAGARINFGSTVTLYNDSALGSTLVVSNAFRAGAITSTSVITAAAGFNSTVASAGAAFQMTQGARLITNGATATHYLADDGTNLVVTGMGVSAPGYTAAAGGRFISLQAANSHGFQLSQGARFTMDGAFETRYFSYNGTDFVLTSMGLTMAGALSGATTGAFSGAITSSVASGSNAISLLDGARVSFGTDYLSYVGGNLALTTSGHLQATGQIKSAQASGSSAFVMTQGARFYTNGTTNSRYISDSGSEVTVTGGLTGNSYFQATQFVGASSTAALLRGTVVDGAAAIGVKLGNQNALSTAGAKAAAFYSDNMTTEVASIGYNGALTIAGVASGSAAITMPVGARLYTNGATATHYLADDGVTLVAAGHTSFQANSLVASTYFSSYATSGNTAYVMASGARLITNGAGVATRWISDDATDMVLNLTAGVRIGSTAAPRLLSGSGTPESVITAPIGSLFLRTNGGAGTSIYVKESGAGNTGWVAK